MNETITKQREIKDYFVKIGEFQDDVFRTDFERKQIFYENGISKFVNAFIPSYKIPEHPKGLLMGILVDLFSPKSLKGEPIVIGRATITKENALETMTKSGFADDIESAEKIFSELLNAAHPIKDSLAFCLIEKDNYKGDKVYEMEIIDYYYSSGE